MDLSCFQSPEVAPMLVKLYDKHKLYSGSKEGRPQARAELSKTVCSLLEMPLSEREKESIADVLIALLRQAEIDLREALAERLAVLDYIPLRLVLEMANDHISVARPVLKASEVLKDEDLVYIIKSKSSEYWQAIAARKAVSDKIMNILADTKDVETAIALAENHQIKLTPHTLSVLSDIARGKEMLAQPLMRREEVTPELAAELYQYVGMALKHEIAQKFGKNREKVERVIDSTVQALSQKDEEAKEAMLVRARLVKAKGLLNEPLLIQTLKRGEYKYFVALFSTFLGLDHQVVLQILRQTSGQNLAIVCRSKGVLKTDFISLYLLTGFFRRDERMAAQAMSEAISHFEQIRPETALKIVESSMMTQAAVTPH